MGKNPSVGRDDSPRPKAEGRLLPFPGSAGGPGQPPDRGGHRTGPHVEPLHMRALGVSGPQRTGV